MKKFIAVVVLVVGMLLVGAPAQALSYGYMPVAGSPGPVVYKPKPVVYTTIPVKGSRLVPISSVVNPVAEAKKLQNLRAKYKMALMRELIKQRAIVAKHKGRR